MFMRQLQPLFPQPILIENIPGTWLDQAKKIEYRPTPGFQQTSGDIHKSTDWMPLAEKILHMAREGYANEVGYDPDSIYISNMWINRFDPNGTIHPHFHSNSLFSCVMYLDDYGAGTSFYRPDPIAHHPTNMVSTQWNWNDYTTKPMQYDIVFFPSHLRHNSKPCSKTRYTLSANFVSNSYGLKAKFNWGHPNHDEH